MHFSFCPRVHISEINRKLQKMNMNQTFDIFNKNHHVDSRNLKNLQIHLSDGAHNFNFVQVNEEQEGNPPKTCKHC